MLQINCQLTMDGITKNEGYLSFLNNMITLLQATLYKIKTKNTTDTNYKLYV